MIMIWSLSVIFSPLFISLPSNQLGNASTCSLSEDLISITNRSCDSGLSGPGNLTIFSNCKWPSLLSDTKCHLFCQSFCFHYCFWAKLLCLNLSLWTEISFLMTTISWLSYSWDVLIMTLLSIILGIYR